MARWTVDPEVPGEMGPNTVMDVSTHPPRVSTLHVVFHDWLGDDLVTTFPCYLVTPRLAEALEGSELTGFQLRDAQIGRSEELDHASPSLQLPAFRWLQLVGGDSCDLHLRADGLLVLSDRAKQLLERFTLAHAVIAGPF